MTKPRPPALPFLAVLLLALGTVVACGGGASPPERYFQKLEDTRQALSERFTSLQDEFETALASDATEAETIEAAQDYYGGNLSLLEDTVSRLEEIEPPAEIAGAAQAHQEFVEAMKGFVAVFEDLSARAESAVSASELEGLLAGAERDEFDAVSARFAQACLALQGLADANGIDADLNCEG
jgi:Xaa-Pro aminopeptidase